MSPDHGDPSDAEVLWLWRAGEQRDVQPVRSGGNCRFLPGALVEPCAGGPGGAGGGAAHLQWRLCLVPHLPGKSTGCVRVRVWQTSRETGTHLGMDRHNMSAQFGASSMICVISLELL